MIALVTIARHATQRAAVTEMGLNDVRMPILQRRSHDRSSSLLTNRLVADGQTDGFIVAIQRSTNAL